MSARAIDSNDPAVRAMLLDLFTDVGILEQLVREWLKPLAGPMAADQFNVVNHLMRIPQDGEKLTTLAWCFQVEMTAMTQTVEALTMQRYVEIDWVDGERRVFLTAAGRKRHAEIIEAAAPLVAEIVGELDPANLRLTADTLRELRRTFDNLPGR